MFIVHNVTSRRVALKLHPSKAAADGTPNWQARRFARQHTFHVVVEPHRTVDLMTFGYSEAEVLAQPEVLEYLRLGYIRRVKDEGGGYTENQFGVQAVATSVLATKMAEDALEARSVAPAVVEKVEARVEPVVVKPEPVVRKPFRPKKR